MKKNETSKSKEKLGNNQPATEAKRTSKHRLEKDKQKEVRKHRTKKYKNEQSGGKAR